ncbi:MAG TPA: hypothetical protein VHM70_25360 [Polyangiaceae bacterium]|jgi:hypothetical protein|nr:hypothetical protein [Polyangiaceae bacterium]
MAKDDSELEPQSAKSGPPSLRDTELNDLFKRAFETEEDVSSVDVLHGVQQRLHDRSGGKFYRDGWSTARHPPFGTYFITSLMMLAVICIIYAILTPLVGDPVRVDPVPAPVRILPP